MRVLVCGGRGYADAARVDLVLSTLQISQLAHGGASGADTLAGQWAAGRGIPVRVYRADWQGDGRAAGPRRNQRMLEDFRPDLVVAFPGGRGTADMVRRADGAEVPIMAGGRPWEGVTGDLLEALEERAAIREYDGGLHRLEAERAAAEDLRK